MGLRGKTNLTDEHLFFVTTTTIGSIKIFTEDIYCDILINNIKHYQEKYKFEILAYVIMPSHFHWIVMLNIELGTISEIMRDIKKYSAWDIMEIIQKKNSGLIKIFKDEAARFKNQKRKFWTARFDDEVIRNEKMFWTKLHFIHKNPVKAGLVDLPEQYKYSSATNYVDNDHSIIKINTSFVGTEIR
jgi:REP-associated tyrosine transposase